MKLISIFSSNWGRQSTGAFTEMSDCSFNECAWESEPHCHRCTSPQMIALCVCVSPLYSTPDKMCVSVHDACNDKQSDERMCLHHMFHATPYATFISLNLWQNYKNLGLDSNPQTDPWDFGEQYCSAWCTWLCTNNRSHTTAFTSGTQNTSTVAMHTTEIWYQILNGFYRNSVYN